MAANENICVFISEGLYRLLFCGSYGVPFGKKLFVLTHMFFELT